MSLLFPRRSVPPRERINVLMAAREQFARVPRLEDRRLLLSTFGSPEPSLASTDDYAEATRLTDALGQMPFGGLLDLVGYLDSDEAKAHFFVGPQNYLQALREDCREWLRTIADADAVPSILRDSISDQIREVIRLTEQADLSASTLSAETDKMMRGLAEVVAYAPPEHQSLLRERVAKTAASVVLIVATLHTPLDVLQIANAVQRTVQAIASADRPVAPAIRAPQAPLALESGYDGEPSTT